MNGDDIGLRARWFLVGAIAATIAVGLIVLSVLGNVNDLAADAKAQAMQAQREATKNKRTRAELDDVIAQQNPANQCVNEHNEEACDLFERVFREMQRATGGNLVFTRKEVRAISRRVRLRQRRKEGLIPGSSPTGTSTSSPAGGSPVIVQRGGSGNHHRAGGSGGHDDGGSGGGGNTGGHRPGGGGSGGGGSRADGLPLPDVTLPGLPDLRNRGIHLPRLP